MLFHLKGSNGKVTFHIFKYCKGCLGSVGAIDKGNKISKPLQLTMVILISISLLLPFVSKLFVNEGLLPNLALNIKVSKPSSRHLAEKSTVLRNL